MGYKNVHWYRGGIQSWKAAGLAPEAQTFRVLSGVTVSEVIMLGADAARAEGGAQIDVRLGDLGGPAQGPAAQPGGALDRLLQTAGGAGQGGHAMSRYMAKMLILAFVLGVIFTALVLGLGFMTIW